MYRSASAGAAEHVVTIPACKLLSRESGIRQKAVHLSFVSKFMDSFELAVVGQLKAFGRFDFSVRRTAFGSSNHIVFRIIDGKKVCALCFCRKFGPQRQLHLVIADPEQHFSPSE